MLHLQKRAQEEGKVWKIWLYLAVYFFCLFLVEGDVTGWKRALARNHRPWPVYTGKLLGDLQLTPGKAANVSNKIQYCEQTKTCGE